MEKYKKKVVLYNVGKISVFSTLLFFVVYIAALGITFGAIEGNLLATGKVWGDAILAVALVAIGIVVHEFLHALGAILFGKAEPSDIRIGAQLRNGLFYCHCAKPISVNAYRATLILPVIVTGIIPFVISLFFGGLILTAAFAVLIAGGLGDIVMFCGLLKEKGDRLVLDHPKTTAYYLLYTPEEFDGEEMTEEEEEKQIALSRTKGAASLGVKILLIAIFLALTVLVIYVTALVMQFI